MSYNWNGFSDSDLSKGKPIKKIHLEKIRENISWLGDNLACQQHMIPDFRDDHSSSYRSSSHYSSYQSLSHYSDNKSSNNSSSYKSGDNGSSNYSSHRTSNNGSHYTDYKGSHGTCADCLSYCPTNNGSNQTSMNSAVAH